MSLETASQGARFFRTESGALRAPWRVLIFGALLFAIAFIVAQVGSLLAGFVPLERWARWGRVSLDVWATALAVIVATWATGRLVHGADSGIWRMVALDRSAWAPRKVLLGLLVGALVLAVPVALMVAAGQMRFESATAIESPAIVIWSAIALLLPAAVSEELLIRGYVFSAARDGAGVNAAVIITSVGFGLAHITNPDPSLISLIAVTFAGTFLAFVRLVTGSLVAAIAAHLAFNLTQTVVFHAPVSGMALQTPGYRLVPVGPAWLTGGGWGPEGGVAVIVTLIVASLLLLKRSAPMSLPTPTLEGTERTHP